MKITINGNSLDVPSEHIHYPSEGVPVESGIWAIDENGKYCIVDALQLALAMGVEIKRINNKMKDAAGYVADIISVSDGIIDFNAKSALAILSDVYLWGMDDGKIRKFAQELRQ